VTADLRGT